MAINATLLTKDNVPINPPTTMDQVTGLVDALDKCVLKIEGMGLSSKDFTQALLDKLNSLENYNDSSVKALITTEENRAKAAESANSSSIQAIADGYVQKISGKGLSTNDFTTALS